MRVAGERPAAPECTSLSADRDVIVSDIARKLGIDFSKSATSALLSADEENNAAYVLDGVYGEDAGQEALLRALMAHRNENYSLSRFWAAVYLKLETRQSE
jgi:hypothetical protein